MSLFLLITCFWPFFASVYFQQLKNMNKEELKIKSYQFIYLLAFWEEIIIWKKHEANS